MEVYKHILYMNLITFPCMLNLLGPIVYFKSISKVRLVIEKYD